MGKVRKDVSWARCFLLTKLLIKAYLVLGQTAYNSLRFV